MNGIQFKIDHDDARFIDAVRYYGGEAAMHEIRGRTGLTPGKAHHRFDKLADLELIDVTKQPYKSKQEEKVAHLTGTARMEIERGLLDGLTREFDDETLNDLLSEVRGLRDDVERVENKVDVLTSTVRDIDSEFSDLEEYVYGWTEFAETYLLAVRQVLEEKLGVDMNQHLQDVEDDRDDV